MPLREEVMVLIISGTYGVFGSITHYLYRIATKKAPQFKIGMFLLNGLFGFYIGVAAGSFIPQDFASRDGLLLVSGFLVYQIFDIVEAQGLDYIKKKLGVEDEEEE